jgi:hypothetical protein
MCNSLKLCLSALPRWPEVPKATRSARSAGLGWSAWYAVHSLGTLASVVRGAGFPARGWTMKGASGARLCNTCVFAAALSIVPIAHLIVASTK